MNAFYGEGKFHIVEGGQGDGRIRSFDCDGTVDSILNAIDKAMEDTK